MPIDYKKNYYNLLQVPADASPMQIKQAYRKLAHRFHPDKNAGDILASSIFMDIAEAYSILSDAGQRNDYDLRSGAGISNPSKSTSTINPVDEIIKESGRLKTTISQSDPYRLNKDALMYHLSALLSDVHLYALQQIKQPNQLVPVVSNLLFCAGFLHVKDAAVICSRLFLFTEGNNELQETIHNFLKKQQKKQLWERYKVLAAFALALLLCVLAYYISNSNHS